MTLHRYANRREERAAVQARWDAWRAGRSNEAPDEIKCPHCGQSVAPDQVAKCPKRKRGHV